MAADKAERPQQPPPGVYPREKALFFGIKVPARNYAQQKITEMELVLFRCCLLHHIQKLPFRQIPLCFFRLGIDPAVASGPLITTVNDLVAVVSYYGLAWLMLLSAVV